MEDKQQFPKWMYGPGGESKIVESAIEMDALAGWAESPAEVGKVKAGRKAKE